MSWPELVVAILAGACIAVGVAWRTADALRWVSDAVARAVVPDRIPLGPARRGRGRDAR